VDAEAFEEPVVRVPELVRPRLDPGAFDGPLAEVPAAVERDTSQRWVGPACYDDADRPGMFIGSEDQERGCRDAGEAHDLAADRLRGCLWSVACA
jgi:hypothetical protein